MLVAVGDIHLGSGKQFGPERYKDILNSLDQAIDYAIRKDVKYFAFLGDIYEHPSPPNYLRKEFAKRIQRLTHIQMVTIIILAGNHDFANGTHAFADLQQIYINNINVYDNYSDIIKKHEWLLIPHNEYVDRKEETWYDYFNSLVFSKKKNQDFSRKKKKRILLGHFPVSGSSIHDNYNYESSECVTKGQLKKSKADLILLGDIHKPQKLFDNCYYVGSIDKRDFGEVNNKNRFMHVDWDLKVKSVPVKTRKITRLEVTNPLFENIDKKKIKNAIVKPVIKCSYDRVREFDTKKLVDLVKSMNPHYIMELQWDMENTRKRIKIKSKKDIDIKKYLKKYIKRNYPKTDSKKIMGIYETIKS